MLGSFSREMTLSRMVLLGRGDRDQGSPACGHRRTQSTDTVRDRDTHSENKSAPGRRSITQNDRGPGEILELRYALLSLKKKDMQASKMEVIIRLFLPHPPKRNNI